MPKCAKCRDTVDLITCDMIVRVHILSTILLFKTPFGLFISLFVFVVDIEKNAVVGYTTLNREKI